MPFQHLSCDALKNSLADKKTFNIIDIRDQASYAAGHIEGAVHIDNGNVGAFVQQADKLIPLVVCCYHGNSSQSAADYFSEQGFRETYSLDGGFEHWKTLG